MAADASMPQKLTPDHARALRDVERALHGLLRTVVRAQPTSQQHEAELSRMSFVLVNFKDEVDAILLTHGIMPISSTELRQPPA